MGWVSAPFSMPYLIQDCTNRLCLEFSFTAFWQILVRLVDRWNFSEIESYCRLFEFSIVLNDLFIKRVWLECVIYLAPTFRKKTCWSWRWSSQYRAKLEHDLSVWEFACKVSELNSFRRKTIKSNFIVTVLVSSSMLFAIAAIFKSGTRTRNSSPWYSSKYIIPFYVCAYI